MVVNWVSNGVNHTELLFCFTSFIGMNENIFHGAGVRIRALRGELSQAAIARRLGVSSKAVEGWEAGASLPSGSSLLRIREEFGADINYLLTGTVGGIAPTLRPDEEELLANYRACNSDAREKIRKVAQTAVNSPKRTKKPSIQVGVLNGHLITGDGTVHAPQNFGFVKE